MTSNRICNTGHAPTKHLNVYITFIFNGLIDSSVNISNTSIFSDVFRSVDYIKRGAVVEKRLDGRVVIAARSWCRKSP